VPEHRWPSWAPKHVSSSRNEILAVSISVLTRPHHDLSSLDVSSFIASFHIVPIKRIIVIVICRRTRFWKKNHATPTEVTWRIFQHYMIDWHRNMGGRRL